MDNYFIKKDYQINQINLTNDKFNEIKYWNKNRKLSSKIFQFPVYKFLDSYIKENQITTLIDVGCGIGNKLVYINNSNPNLKIIGIDQKDPIDFCRENYNFGEWIVDDFESKRANLNLKAQLVVCCDVIEHIQNPDLLIDYLKERVKKNGRIILSTPERDRLRGNKNLNSPNKFHVREWNYNELEEYLKHRGFKIINHFVQYPLKFGINFYTLNFFLKRVLKFKPLRYNQLIVLKLE